jgi:hypothetical protein
MVQVCQWLAKGQQFSPGTMVSSTNKTDCHNITEILLKVALNTITLTLLLYEKYSSTVIFQLRFWGRYWGRMRKRLFYSPISWGEIPNCLVIKLLVKICNESFFKQIKSRTFSRLWPGYCLFWLCKRNTMHKIPGTSAVYWVTWFVESGVYRLR